MTNVVVARPRTIQVSANSTGGKIDTIVPVTLKNTGMTTTAGAASARLDHLTDVDASGETNGAVPVYDAATDRYIVKTLNFADVVGDLDGGVF